MSEESDVDLRDRGDHLMYLNVSIQVLLQICLWFSEITKQGMG